jgi:hypothetical protein
MTPAVLLHHFQVSELENLMRFIIVTHSVQIYCIPSQPERSDATLCSLMNVRFISAQGLEMLKSRLKKSTLL